MQKWHFCYFCIFKVKLSFRNKFLDIFDKIPDFHQKVKNFTYFFKLRYILCLLKEF